jgi:hypothetical protein
LLSRRATKEELMSSVRHHVALSLLAQLVWFLIGCGGEEPAGGSCAVSGTSTACIEFTGQLYQGQTAMAQQKCTQAGGTYTTSSCAVEGLLGSCVVFQGTGADQVWKYYQIVGTSTVAEQRDRAQRECGQTSGRWITA